jgi:hypothetical protein
MARKGPVTRDTTTLALGLAQLRVGAYEANKANIHPVLTADDSVGAITQCKLNVEREFWEHFSGFPLSKDYTIPIRESCSVEAAIEEITPKNLALANGIDITAGTYDAHSGEVPFGGLSASAFIRVELAFTFPNGLNYMDVILPRAQVSSNLDLDLQAEDNVKVPITIASNDCSSDAGGSAVWDDKPLGRASFR